MNSLSYKTLFLAIIVLMKVKSVLAQGYKISPGDSVRGKIELGGRAVLNINQIHPGKDTLHLKWKQIYVNMPSGWDGTICDYGHCYSTLKDTGTMDPVLPGDDALISMHFFASKTPGTAIIRYILTSGGPLFQSDTLTWIVDGTFSFIQSNSIEKPSIIINSHSLKVSCRLCKFSELSIANMQGQALLTSQFKNSETIEIPLDNFREGIYILSLKGNGTYYSQKIILTQ
jgi:hypothetical protein